MEQVARKAGVSTATLYAYFPSKAELFRIVVEVTIADIAERVRRSADIQGDARVRLLAFSIAYAEFYCDPAARALFRMVVAERRRFPALADTFHDRGRVELGGTLMAVLGDLARAGQLDLHKPSWAAGQLQGMIEHATLILGLVGGDEAMPARPPQVIATEAVETFLARYGVRQAA
jgi:AcrR family transcriptional regulator